MIEDLLRSVRFRHEREASWRELERLLNQVEAGSARRLSNDDLIVLPALYRAALSSLSVARATSLDKALIEYLEALSTRAYFIVYGARTTLGERVISFFARDWPNAVRGLWRETLAAALFTLIGAVVAYAFTTHDPDWYYSFIPDALADQRNPAATTQTLHDILYQKSRTDEMLGGFATFLFTHNAQIALMAFALGFAFCLPTMMLLVANGFTVGAMFALYMSRGLGPQLFGWMMIHGVTELFAITLAGAAGTRIGLALAFPRGMTRLESAARAGREGGIVMAGVVVMLFVAGLLEGFARQLITDDGARYAVAGASALAWGLYFYARPSLARPSLGRPSPAPPSPTRASPTRASPTRASPTRASPAPAGAAPGDQGSPAKAARDV